MCCTFGDLTDVQWWRELQLPVRTVIGRDGRLIRETPAWLERRRRGGVRRAPGRQDRRSRAREAMVGLLRESGDLDGEPDADARGWRTSTRTATSRSRSSRPGSGTSATAAATTGLRDELLERGDEIDWIPPPHAAPLRQLGRRPQRRLADLAASGSSASRSRSGTRSTTRASPTTTHPLLPREAELPLDPSTRRPAGLRRGPARQAGRLRRRPRRDGHLGDVVADARRSPAAGCTDEDLFARVFPMDLCTHAHDIIRTWLFSRVVRAHFEQQRGAVVARDDLRLHRRPRPQEDVEVQGQRVRADRHPGAVRRRRGPLARRDRPAPAPTRRSTRRR